MGTASKSAIAPVGPRESFRRGDRHAATGIHAADSDGQVDQFFPVWHGPCGFASIIRHLGRGRGAFFAGYSIGVVRAVSSVLTTKTASSLAGSVVLAFRLIEWVASGGSDQLSPA